MIKKLILFVFVVGGLTSALLIIVPSPTQISWYNGFRYPSSADFTAGKQTLCLGVNYPYSLSKLNAGYPIKNKLTADFNDCTYPGKSHVTKTILSDSVRNWQFYADWLIWSSLWFGVALGAIKLSQNK